MKNIQTIKIGNTVNISIDGKLHQKNCGSPEEARELYGIVLRAKSDPSDANLKAIRMYLNEKIRVAFLTGLESDVETGEVFIAGFNTPIPTTLVEVLKEYHENQYPVDAVINFWKLLMLNPDKRVRTSAFDFIHTHDFVLTDTGYMVVYKAVAYKEQVDNDLLEFVTNQYLHVKKDWKCSANKYVVYRDEDGNLALTKAVTADGWDDDKDVEILGKLGDLNASLDKLAETSSTVYTDKHSHTMEIRLGVPVVMPRKDCDSDPAIDCSYGLHVGATNYVKRFGSNGDAVLVCLVNPAHIVAVPDYDHSKMRVAEYFPIAKATYTNGEIDIIEQAYFESDYRTYEDKDLEKMLAKIKKQEKPIEKAINAEEEERPMSELLKIIESRMIDI
jgi:hypothetical protein